jgi:hypothetical protein
MRGQVVAVLRNDTVDQQIQYASVAVENAELALEKSRKRLPLYDQVTHCGRSLKKNYKRAKHCAPAKSSAVFDLSHLSLTLNIDELDIIRSGRADGDDDGGGRRGRGIYGDCLQGQHQGDHEKRRNLLPRHDPD